MVPCHDFLAETKDVRGVVVEDVALLLFDRDGASSMTAIARSIVPSQTIDLPQT